MFVIIVTYPLSRLRRSKEDGYKCQPDDAGCVHSKSNGLGLVESLRHATGLDGVNSACDHQEDAVAQRADERQVRDVALEHPSGLARVGRALLAVIHHRVRRVDGEPHEHAEQLHRDQAEGNDQLRGGAYEPRGGHRLLPLLEDAVDAVGLGQQGGVAEAHAQTQEHAAEGAHPQTRRGDHEEGDGVTQEDARQQHVAHLPAGRPHDWRVVVAYEGHHHETGGQDAHDGHEHRHGGPRRVPLQFDDGNGDAAGAVLVGTLFVGTQLAGELVGLVVIAFASLAVPAAGNALHDLLPLAHSARNATHRDRKSGVARTPSHDVHLRRRRKTNAVRNVCRRIHFIPLSSRESCGTQARLPTFVTDIFRDELAPEAFEMK